MKFIKKNLLKLLLTAFLVALPVISFAQTNSSQPTVKLDNPIGAPSIQEFIRIFLEGILKIGMPIVALAVIYCGFLFVKAQGKPEAITKAKDALLYTLIGAAVLLGSWAIAKLVADTVISIGTP